MEQQEALRRWLWTAQRKGQQHEELVKEVQRGMPVDSAVLEYERPIYLSPRLGDQVTISRIR